MDSSLKQRLVGALVLIALAVIFLPSLFDGSGEMDDAEPVAMPERPKFEVISPLVKDTEQRKAEIEQQIESDRAAYNPPETLEAPATVNTDTKPEDAETDPIPASVEPKPQPVASEQTKPAADNQLAKAWTIQLASFSEPKNAENLRDKLVKQKYRAYTETHQTADGKVTRVFVGPDLRKADAEKILAQLKQRFELQGMIMRYEPNT